MDEDIRPKINEDKGMIAITQHEYKYGHISRSVR